MGRFREGETCEVRAVWVQWFALNISNQTISLDAWMFSKRMGFCRLRWVWDNRFSIDSRSRCCIWETAVSQWSRERQKNGEIFYWAKVCHCETPEAIPNTSGVSSEVQQEPLAKPQVIPNDLHVSNPSEAQNIIKECDNCALLNVKNRKLRNLTYYNNDIIKFTDVLKRSYYTISTLTLEEHKHCVKGSSFSLM